MTSTSVDCPSCGAGLIGTQGKALVICSYCGVEVRLSATFVDTVTRALDKRAEAEPKMKALMERYCEHLVAGDKPRAMVYYEAFQYLVLWTAYEVDDLEELEAMVQPLMKDVARQLEAEYVGRRVSWAVVEQLLS